MYWQNNLLQWGRDQLIAELPSQTWDVVSQPDVLQWGRDQLIAELRPENVVR